MNLALARVELESVQLLSPIVLLCCFFLCLNWCSRDWNTILGCFIFKLFIALDATMIKLHTTEGLQSGDERPHRGFEPLHCDFHPPFFRYIGSLFWVLHIALFAHEGIFAPTYPTCKEIYLYTNGGGWWDIGQLYAVLFSLALKESSESQEWIWWVLSSLSCSALRTIAVKWSFQSTKRWL